MSFKEENYYQILDVAEDATTEEIRVAYELASQTFNTDSLATYSLFSEEENDEILRKITQAYMTLIDPITRAYYDQTLSPQKLQSFIEPNVLSHEKTLLSKDAPFRFREASSSIKFHPDSHTTMSEETSKNPLSETQTSSKTASYDLKESASLMKNSENKRGRVSEMGTASVEKNEPAEPSGKSSEPKALSELLEEHLTERTGNRKTIAQKNKDSHEKVQQFLASVDVYSGNVLREIREMKSIELEEMSQETCVRQLYLSAIENEDYLKLPTALIYLKSFVNSYARCLELPAEQVIDDYLSLYEERQKRS